MRHVRMKDMITRTFETLSPSDSLQKVARLLRSTKLDALPVEDGRGQLIGIMTKANLYDAVAVGKSPLDPIQGLFEKKVFTMQEDMSYAEVAELVRSSHAGNAVVMDGSGCISGMFTKVSWIMAMFRKETELSTQLQAILNTMHNGLLAIDSKGIITSLNHAAEGLLHIRASQSLGRSITDFLPGLNLEATLRDYRTWKISQALIGIRYNLKGASLVCNITPIFRRGMVDGAILVLQDLTDLDRIASELEHVKRLNKTLQSVMDFAYDGIIVVDEIARITMVNKAAADFFKKSEAEIIGKDVDLIIENTRLREVIKTGLPEINQLQFIGGVPYIVARLPIIRGGRVVGAIGKIFFRNLNEIKDLAAKLVSIEAQIPISESRNTERDNDSTGFEQIVTADTVFRRVLEEAEIVARGTSNILITGESGTGKELVARAIHKSSPYGTGPLVEVNCAAIPENLIESEFFGYAEGAFTGARRGGKKGKLAAAHGGTLFLDEIGDMPLHLQSKLLRVLQDKCFEPVGSNQSIAVNARIISATNQNLDELVAFGKFRADLFYRLNVIHLHIPPLRERHADICLLIQYFLQRYNRIFGTSVQGVSEPVKAIFGSYDWPGNVREVENVIERAVNFAREALIAVEDLPVHLQTRTAPIDKHTVPLSCRMFRPGREQHERQMIIDALDKAGGNKAEAARLLGISRSWLYEKMTRTGLK